MKSMYSNEIMKEKENACGGTAERSVRGMKGLFKRIKLFVIAFAFLGATGAGMTALVNQPVLAAETTVYKTGAETGYTIPNEITIKKGETKTITLNVPKGSTDVTNVDWGNQANGCFSVIEIQHGSYWGKKAYITIKGTGTGTGYINSVAKVFKTKGRPETYKYSAFDKCVVKVVDGNVASGNATTSSTGKTNTVTTNTKRPLQSIYLNATSLNLQKGKSYTLKVGYNPSNTTDSKSVKWTTSNANIATISNGNVVAKGAGTATITANVNGKKATCTVKVTAPVTVKDGYLNVDQAYTLLNNFRTGTGVWQWNADNRTKTYFNTTGSNRLYALKRNASLERVAQVRAKELAQKYSHTRPNGSSCFTAYPQLPARGENIASGQTTASVVTECWKETNENYAGQGHRRNMLDKNFNSVGIACYRANGKTYWVQAFGKM